MSGSSDLEPPHRTPQHRAAVRSHHGGDHGRMVGVHLRGPGACGGPSCGPAHAQAQAPALFYSCGPTCQGLRAGKQHSTDPLLGSPTVCPLHGSGQSRPPGTGSTEARGAGGKGRWLQAVAPGAIGWWQVPGKAEKPRKVLSPVPIAPHQLLGSGQGQPHGPQQEAAVWPPWVPSPTCVL